MSEDKTVARVELVRPSEDSTLADIYLVTDAVGPELQAALDRWYVPRTRYAATSARTRWDRVPPGFWRLLPPKDESE